MASLERFLHDMYNKQNDWDRFVIGPYHLAYEFAVSNFKATLNEQKKVDQLKSDLAMAGLSIAGGSMLTAAFGKAALSAASSKLAMSAIYNNNLDRCFDVAYKISQSPTSQFALSSIIDGQIGKRIEAAAKGVISTEMASKTPVVATTPGAMKTKMQMFVQNARARMYKLVTRAWDGTGKKTFSQAEKEQLLVDLRTTAFFNPPTSSISSGTGVTAKPSPLARRIELLYYLMMIADADYFIDHPTTYSATPTPRRSDKHVKTGALANEARQGASLGRSVLVSPDDPRYPKAEGSGQGMMYEDMGVALANRCNLLYKQETDVSQGKPIFVDSINYLLDEPITATEVARAYAAIKKIGPLAKRHVDALTPRRAKKK